MNKPRNASIDGIGSIYGSKLDNVVINGIGKVRGKSEVGSFIINGIGKATGEIKANLVKVNGICRFKRDISAKRVENYGFIKVKYSLEAEEFVTDGIVDILGSVTVDNLKCIFTKFSYIKELFGDTINIQSREEGGNNIFQGPLWLFKLIFGGNVRKGKFVCSTIECTSLNAEHLAADVVRAQDIVLGPGCEVNCVEYYNSYAVDKSCVVKKVVKLS